MVSKILENAGERPLSFYESSFKEGIKCKDISKQNYKCQYQYLDVI